MVLQMNERNRIDQVIQNLSKNLKEFSEIILRAAESSAAEKSAGNGSASAAAEKPKKKKAEKDPNAPKRNLSSYMLYSQSVRPDVVKQHPTVRPVDIAKLIGEKWNALTDKEKLPFVKAAEKEKARFDKETKTYKATLGEPTESKESTPVKRKTEETDAEPVSEKKEKKKSKKSSSSHESSDGKKRSHKKK